MKLFGRMFPEVKNSAALPWVPGPYPGVELCVLHRDAATGGVTVLRKFKPGVTVPAHVHPLADELVYVLSGTWVEDGVSHGPGTVFRSPKGVQHGPHYAPDEVISLTVFNGPLTVA